ncbi:hypothetical protein DRB06_14075 [Actinomyces sp. Z5]|uniref:transposase n=1 Tax=Actinomyces sp. Z5 TaxID=2250216 RepID=UPI000DCE6CD5|nr:hypothetical protein DRB06_14075 [Actinomyces sp. Z5]
MHRGSTLRSCGSGLPGWLWRPVGTRRGLRGRTWRIAEELGVHPEALRTWVKKAEVDAGARPGTTSQDAERIRQLEK